MRERELVLAHSLRVWLATAGESRQAEPEADGCITSITRNSVKNVLSFLPFVQSRIPAQGMEPSRVNKSSHLDYINQDIPFSSTQRPVSQVVLNLTKLMTEKEMVGDGGWYD